MREQLIEWVEFMSPGKAGEDTWISRVKIEHHADRELVAWVEREAEEGAREFAERVYAIAENDAEAMGDGQQLYMLRIYRPGEDDDKWQIRRPLRILQPFPEQGQAAEQPDHSLSRVIASSGVSPQVVREGMATRRSEVALPCPRQGCAFQSNHPSRCLDAHGVPLPLAELCEEVSPYQVNHMQNRCVLSKGHVGFHVPGVGLTWDDGDFMIPHESGVLP